MGEGAKIRRGKSRRQGFIKKIPVWNECGWVSTFIIPDPINKPSQLNPNS